MAMLTMAMLTMAMLTMAILTMTLLNMALGARCVTTASRLRETTETRTRLSRSDRVVRVRSVWRVRVAMGSSGFHTLPPRKLRPRLGRTRGAMPAAAPADQSAEEMVARLALLQGTLAPGQLDAEADLAIENWLFGYNLDAAGRDAVARDAAARRRAHDAVEAVELRARRLSKVEAAILRAHEARTIMYRRDLGPIAAMVERHGTIGPFDDLQFTDLIVPSLTLLAKRGMACCCFQLRALLTPVLRGPTLDVGPCDATWENAVFVARLPGLRTLRIDGEHFLPEVDVERVRSRPRLKIGQMGATAALFVGALIADGNLLLRLSDDNRVYIRPFCSFAWVSMQMIYVDASEYLVVDFEDLRGGRAYGKFSVADACALLGPLSRNQASPHWPFNEEFSFASCRAAMRRSDAARVPRSKSTNSYMAEWNRYEGYQMWARAAKGALPELWAGQEAQEKEAARQEALLRRCCQGALRANRARPHGEEAARAAREDHRARAVELINSHQPQATQRAPSEDAPP
eukprot:scaffold8275_cov61-Phaeocystis_antarctica.AAC.5